MVEERDLPAVLLAGRFTTIPALQKQRNKKIIYDIYCDGTFLGFLPKKSLFFVVEKYQLECDEFSISVNEEDYRLLEEKIYK